MFGEHTRHKLRRTAGPPRPQILNSAPKGALQMDGQAGEKTFEKFAHLAMHPLAGEIFTMKAGYLMALGVPLLFFLLLSGGNPDAFFGHVANLGDRFLAADLARRVTFLGQFKFVLIGLATLVVMWRMPRFIRDLDRELSGEKL